MVLHLLVGKPVQCVEWTARWADVHSCHKFNSVLDVNFLAILQQHRIPVNSPGKKKNHIWYMVLNLVQEYQSWARLIIRSISVLNLVYQIRYIHSHNALDRHPANIIFLTNKLPRNNMFCCKFGKI